MSRTLNALFLALCLPVLASGCPLEREAQVPQARAGDTAVADVAADAGDAAAAADGYTQVSRSRDGIGKAYMGREFEKSVERVSGIMCLRSLKRSEPVCRRPGSGVRIRLF